MGNCFSDPSHKKPSGHDQKLGSGASGGQRLGGSTSNAVNGGNGNVNGNGAGSVGRKYNDPPRTLGSANSGAGVGVGGMGGGASSEEEQRERMLRAAEERAKASQSKGVSTSNPKSGQLSAKLAAERKKAAAPGPNDERMMDKGQWN